MTYLSYINNDKRRTRNAKRIRPQYQDSTISAAAIFTSSLTRDLGPQFGVGSTIDQLDTIEINEVGSTKELATPWYSDQILPFDITLAGCAPCTYPITITK